MFILGYLYFLFFFFAFLFFPSDVFWVSECVQADANFLFLILVDLVREKLQALIVCLVICVFFRDDLLSL